MKTQTLTLNPSTWTPTKSNLSCGTFFPFTLVVQNTIAFSADAPEKKLNPTRRVGAFWIMWWVEAPSVLKHSATSAAQAETTKVELQHQSKHKGLEAQNASAVPDAVRESSPKWRTRVLHLGFTTQFQSGTASLASGLGCLSREDRV